MNLPGEELSSVRILVVERVVQEGKRGRGEGGGGGAGGRGRAVIVLVADSGPAARPAVAVVVVVVVAAAAATAASVDPLLNLRQLSATNVAVAGNSVSLLLLLLFRAGSE